MHHAVSNFGSRADWNLAASAQPIEQRTLASRGGTGVRVIEKREQFSRGCVACTNFDSQGPLSCCRAHDISRDDLLHKVRLAKAIEAGSGEDDRVVFSFGKFAKAGIDVSAQGVNLKIWTERFQLCLTPQAAGAHAGVLRELGNALVTNRAENILGVLARGNGSDLKAQGEFGRKIFQAVNRKIDAAFGQCFLNFLCEHALGADLGQGNVENLVASRLDDFKLDLMAPRAQQR